MAPRHLIAPLMTLALVACASPTPSASVPTFTPTATGGASQATTVPTPTGPLPARPYDGAAVLQAMRDSRRPGGVPAELQTAEIAAAVANTLWTWDGEPWPELVIGGSCAAAACSLEVAGTPPDAAGADLYILGVDRASATVTVESTDLHGYPRQLDGQLKAIATEVAPDAIRGLRFASAQWMPMAAGQYLLAYRSGGEEGSPGVDLLIDAPSRTLLDQHPV
ncbi:MAG TPA: hypothetical protein VIA82_05400 [Candidatus Limnocylindria bacterium]|jgi:hypothetical protein